MSNTFFRICHFHFGDRYDDYLNADAKEQRRLVNEAANETCIHLQCTNWFNLQTKEGRKARLCHVLALLRWQNAQDMAEFAGDSSDTDRSPSSPSEYQMDGDDAAT